MSFLLRQWATGATVMQQAALPSVSRSMSTISPQKIIQLESLKPSMRLVTGDSLVDSACDSNPKPCLALPEDSGQAMEEAALPLHHAVPCCANFWHHKHRGGGLQTTLSFAYHAASSLRLLHRQAAQGIAASPCQSF